MGLCASVCILGMNKQLRDNQNRAVPSRHAVWAEGGREVSHQAFVVASNYCQQTAFEHSYFSFRGERLQTSNSNRTRSTIATPNLNCREQKGLKP